MSDKSFHFFTLNTIQFNKGWTLNVCHLTLYFFNSLIIVFLLILFTVNPFIGVFLICFFRFNNTNVLYVNEMSLSNLLYTFNSINEMESFFIILMNSEIDFFIMLLSAK